MRRWRGPWFVSYFHDLSYNSQLIACSNVNVPWPQKGMGDAEYLLAFQRLVMPIAMSFDPELVISKHFSGHMEHEKH
jgi:acetoin utilization deacetylase AcuC-like enzyme